MPAAQTEAAPATPLPADALRHFVAELDTLLRPEHVHDYCGIVYADRPDAPSFIKVYDPNHMGSFCSCSSTPTPARWVLSRSRPESMGDEAPAPGARRHWWSRLFAGSRS